MKAVTNTGSYVEVEPICTNCQRETCDSGQHSGCAFVEIFGKGKAPQYLRQDVCGYEDPYQEGLRNQEKYKRSYERRKRAQA